MIGFPRRAPESSLRRLAALGLLAFFTLTLAVTLAGCGSATAPGSVSENASDSVLAATYAPILELAVGESFLPTSASSMLEVATLRNAAGDSIAGPPVTPAQLLLLGSSGSALDLPGTPRALDTDAQAAARFGELAARPSWTPVYYAAVRRGVFYNPPGLRSAYAGIYDVVFYFFFYYYNDWRSGTPQGANDHEGDWEGLTVYLLREGRRSRPVYARYSRHGGSTAARWDATIPDSVGLVGLVVSGADYREDTHLRVRVARGSHANYPFVGEFATGLFTDYATGTGPRIVPEDADRSGATYPAPAIQLFDLDAHDTIFAYPGRWGAPGLPGFGGPFTPIGGTLTNYPLDALLDSATQPYAPARDALAGQDW